MSARPILLVEDNHSDELLTLRAFSKAGVVNPVVVVRDGAEALEYLFSRPSEQFPMLVLLDLNLPKVSGLDVLRQLRADPRTRLLPVLVFTSSSEEEDVVRSYS